MRYIIAVFIIAVLIVRTGFFVSSTYAAAGINQTINFQGKLVDNNGLNVANGNYDIVFYLYAASSGGSALWTETWNSGTTQVAVQDGVFRVALGTHSTFSSFNFNDDSLYLAIKVGADAEMTPRIRFTSVPYAFVAKTVVDDALDFAQFQDILDVDANLTVNQTGFTWTQTYTGTSAPGLSYTASGAVSSGNAAALDVNVSNASTTVPAMMLTNAGSGFALRINDDGTTTDSTPLVVDADGNVGIGTTVPVGKLSVTDTSNSAASLSLTNNTATTIGNAGNTLGVLDLQSTTLTTGNFLNMEVNALTTGTALNISRSGAGLTTGGELVNLDMGAATAGNGLNIATTGVYTGTGLITLTANAATTGVVSSISNTGLTTGTGLLITGGTALQAAGELLDLNMGAATTGSAATLRTTGVFTNTAGLLNITANTATTGSLAALSGTGLTTGTGLSITGGASMAAGGELIDLNMGAATAGNGLNVTTTGVYTGTGLITLTANSATSGDIMNLSATGLTTGSALVMTGPSAAGVTDHFLKITSDVGSASSLIYGAPDFSGSAVTGYGLNITATDSTATANTDYANYSLLTLTGNAAKTGYGTYGRVTTASTTADTTYGGNFSTATTGAVTTGTQNTYGLYSTATSANVAGGTVNAYGGYFRSGGTVASGTINSYGLYIANGTMNTTGTANNFGLYVEAPTGADTNVAGYFGGNVGIGTTAPVSLLSVGTGSPFQVDTNGDIIKLKNLTYAWPTGHTTDGFLKNNGSGTLTWTTITGAGGVTGSGTDNYIPRWNGTTALENSSIFDDGSNVGIGTTAPGAKLHVVGSGLYSGTLALNGAALDSNTGVNISLGTTTSAVKGLNVTSSSTGDMYGLFNTLTNTGTSKTTSGVYSIINQQTTSDWYEGIGAYNWVSTGNDAYIQGAYGAKTHLTTHANDYGMGYSVVSNSLSTGGDQYGLYIDLNDPDTTNYGIYEMGGATNYFSGNVGIGTTGPGAKLEALGSSINGTMTGSLVLQQSGLDYAVYASQDYGGGVGLSVYDDNLSKTFGVYSFDANIDNYFAGNVGIGTTSPYGLLDVGGFGSSIPSGVVTPSALFATNQDSRGGIVMRNTSTGTSADYRFVLADTSDNYLAFSLGGINNTNTQIFGLAKNTAAYLFTYSPVGTRHLALGTFAPDDDIIFGTNNTEKMRILSGGNVGIGTTSPNAKLTVQGTNSTASLGSELLTTTADRDFSGAGNWSGTGWTVGSGVATHVAGANNFVHTFTPTAGKTYQILATVVTTTAGSIYPQIGGIGFSGVGSTVETLTQHSWVITASNTSSLIFLPDSTWAGTIDDVSVKEITQSSAVASLLDSNAYPFLEFRGITSSGDSENIALGRNSIMSNITGIRNTSLGSRTLEYNTTGNSNVAIGYRTLRLNTTGSSNTAIGQYSMLVNTTGSNNSAYGISSLSNNTTGSGNTASGLNALLLNTSGSFNVALGYVAMQLNTTGSNNTAIGLRALEKNTTGSKNVALGYWAGRFQSDGATSLVSPENSIYIGAGSRGYNDSDDNSIVIGYEAIGIGANSVVLGNDSITTTALKGNVGIGTTAPSSLLEVAGDAEIANYLYFGNSTSEYLRWDSSNFLLSDDLLPNANDSLNLGSDTARWADLFLGGETLHLGASTTDEGTISYTSGNVLSFSTDSTTNGDIAFFTDDLYLDKSTGNVGIGTTSPTTDLQIGAGSSSHTQIDPGTLDIRYSTDSRVFLTSNIHALLGTGNGAGGIRFQTLTGGNAYIGGAAAGNDLMLNPTAGNVGIGTTAPSQKLDVLGGNATIRINATSGEPGIALDRAGTTTGFIQAFSTGMGFAGGWTNPQMFLTSGGNVGIGTTAPAGLLHVYGNDAYFGNNTATDGNYVKVRGDGTFSEVGLSSQAYTQISLYGNPQVTNQTSHGGLTLFAQSSGITSGWYPLTFAAGGNIRFIDTASSNATRMLIQTGTGNVGIGTTTPGHKLEVAGSVLLNPNGGGGQYLYLYDTTNSVYGANGWLDLQSTSTLSMATGAYASIATTGNNALYNINFKTQNTERMRIDNSGNVGIGTTSPGEKLEVRDGRILINHNDNGSALLDANVASLDIVNRSGTAGAGPKINFHGWGYGTYSNQIGAAIAAPLISASVSGATQDLVFLTRNADADAELSERMRILKGGNVGIGTSAPVGRFDVTDTSNATASLSLTNNTATTIGNAGNTLGVLDLQSTSLTTGNFLNMELNGLTSGKGLNLTSTSTALTTGRLMSLDWSPSGSTEIYATGDLFRINTGTYANVGNLLNVLDDGSSLFSVSQSQITHNLPTAFNAAGDVSMAYDLIFTNQTTANIFSNGPLSIVAGESWENNNLNLQTYGTGDIIASLSTGRFLVPAGNVGIGTTAPAYTLDVKSTGTNIAQFTGVNSTGCTLSSSGVIACSSDRDLKKNILESELGLDAIMQLRPVTYNWNFQEEGDQTYLGFIAQEVAEVSPDLVTIDNNGYRQLNSIGIIPIVAKAIQEQQGIITTLQAAVHNSIPDAKIATVSAKLENLNTKVSGWDGLFISIQSIIQSIQETFVAIQNQLGFVRSDIQSTKEQVASLSASLTDIANWKEAVSSGGAALGQSTGSAVLGATDSAMLGEVATASSLMVRNNLQVDGRTTLFDLTVLNKLTSGVIQIGAGIDGDEINASTGIRFQTLAQGPVDFMNGKVIIDVDGSISAKHFKLDTLDATSSTGGKAIMPAGEILTTVQTTSVNADSLIYVTIQGDYAPATRYWVTNQVEGDSFMVQFDRPTTLPVEFSWFIIN